MTLSEKIKQLITRPSIINNKDVFIIPIPDTITFYDEDFILQANVENRAHLSKSQIPYFICKYFNPKRFDKNGDVLDSEEEVEENKEDMHNFLEAAKVIQQNNKYTCSKVINSEFFENKDKFIEETDIIILLYVFTGNQNCMLNGFALCEDLNLSPEPYSENVLYIDAICCNPRKPRLDLNVKKISFGEKLINHIKYYAEYQKNYYGLSLSSLMYVMGYYRKQGFRHLKKLEGLKPEKQVDEDKDLTKMAETIFFINNEITENNKKKNNELFQSRKTIKTQKFKNDLELEDYMYIELVDRLYKDSSDDEKINIIEKYWTSRDRFDTHKASTNETGILKKNNHNENIDQNRKTVKEIYDTYRRKNIEPGNEITHFIETLVKKGFSTQRVCSGDVPCKRISTRLLFLSIEDSHPLHKDSPADEGFKMSYQFDKKKPRRKSTILKNVQVDPEIIKEEEEDTPEYPPSPPPPSPVPLVRTSKRRQSTFLNKNGTAKFKTPKESGAKKTRKVKQKSKRKKE